MAEGEHDPPKDGAALAELVELMRRLLADPGGCPWDREQTLSSLRPYLLEEAFEVLEAIDVDDPDQHREELGDLLFQIVFQAELRARQGHFGIDDVVRAITGKMIRRHPHVFPPEGTEAPEIRTAEEQVAHWTVLKRREGRGVLAGVPRALPALARAFRITEKAARVGFDWPDVSGVVAKVEEALGELRAAMQPPAAPEQVAHELGDLLLAVTNLARHLGVHPEDALREATRRFEDRFAAVESALAAAGRRPEEASLEEMDALWNEAKRRGR